MENGEKLKTFIIIWFIAICCAYYCYYIFAQIFTGVLRLFSLLPVITVFSILPLPLSTAHLALPTFFFLVWLGNFKLLLFAFNRSPLSTTPRLPPLTFISIALLPINPKQPNNKLSISSHKPILLAFKAIILILIINVYQYKHNLHMTLITILYFLHMYIGFELGFALAILLVKIFLGFDFKVEPQFNEPYLATSLQDFWGRRWNLMSLSIFRAMVYNPTRAILTPTLGKLRGQMFAIFVTFVVSGLMHEFMYCYLMRVSPTWEVSWFFVLHGLCTAGGVAVNGGFRLHPVVSVAVTVAFVLMSGSWGLFTQPFRNGVDVKIINESSIVLKYLGRNGGELNVISVFNSVVARR